MSLTRIYQAIPLILHSTVHLEQNAVHHVSRVLRATINDPLILFNGEGGEYCTHIIRMSKKEVVVEIDDFIAREVESPLIIHVAQGIARGEKMDVIVQKAVELGVTYITPLITERCHVRLNNEREEKRLIHWRSIIISACEQSGRQRIPRLNPPVVLKEWLETISADRCFVLSPHVKDTPTLHFATRVASVAVLIGPEGGLSEQEVELAKQHDFLPFRLGPRVLRTETATLAALTVLQLAYGDMGKIL